MYCVCDCSFFCRKKESILSLVTNQMGGIDMKIGAYIRVSTQKQSIDGVSLEAQKEHIINHAKMLELINNENEIKYYIDRGISASSLERPEMKKMINDIKSSKLDLIFTYDFSRISREVIDSAIFLKLIKKYKVELKCLYDDIKNETASDRFGSFVKFSYNQYEREKVSERTNTGLDYIVNVKHRYPFGGPILFGYRRDKDKNLVIDDEDANLVKRAFVMASENKKIKEIKEFLNDNQSKKKFINETVKYLLTNEKYIGVMHYKGKRYDDIIPKIIDKKLYEKVSRIISRRPYKDNDKYYFDQVLVCGNCGIVLRCTHGTSHTGEKHYYYKCKKCKKMISQKKLEKKITILNFNGNGDEEKIKKLKNKKYSLKKRINKIRERYVDKQFTDREFLSLILPLEDELTVIERTLKRYKSMYRKQLYADMVTDEDKKNYIQANFQMITVDLESKRILDIIYKDI